MNESDLDRAQKLFRDRKWVCESLNSAKHGVAAKKLESGSFNIHYRKGSYNPSDFGQFTLDGADTVEMCKLAVKLLTDRLKDLDATLRALGCEPPK